MKKAPNWGLDSMVCGRALAAGKALQIAAVLGKEIGSQFAGQHVGGSLRAEALANEASMQHRRCGPQGRLFKLQSGWYFGEGFHAGRPMGYRLRILTRQTGMQSALNQVFVSASVPRF